MKIFLLGYRKLDFEDKENPERRITGYSLFLAQEAQGVVGVLPVSKEGKRFLNAATAKRIGITDQWLDDHIDDFIDISTDFDGKIIDISEYNDQKSEAV